MRVERILAPNPGPFTGPGTNTYLLQAGSDCLIVDPGPIIDAHRSSILAAVPAAGAAGVLVTHTHPDHAPLANPLGRELETPVYGYAPGPDFTPDVLLQDGAELSVGPHVLEVLHTPGHSDDHLCFRVGELLFTGDHIMGGSTVVVEDMAAYLQSLRRLQRLRLERLYPGHGNELARPQAVIAEYLAHRMERERQVLEAVTAGAATVGQVVEAVYADVDPALHPLAAFSVAAHVRKLAAEGAVIVDGSEEDPWSITVAAG